MTTNSLLSAVFFVTLYGCLIPAYAENPQLTSLHRSYDGAVERQLAPIRATYLDQLRKLKASFTKAGDLQAAIETDKEIQRIETEASAAAAKLQVAPDFPKRIFDVVWTWGNKDKKPDATFVVNADGTARLSKASNAWKWEIIGQRGLKLTDPAESNGKFSTITWNPSFSRFEGVGFYDQKIEGEKKPK